MIKKNPNKDTWYVCFSDENKAKLVFIPTGGELFCGEENIEEFNKESAAETRAIELGWEKDLGDFNAD